MAPSRFARFLLIFAALLLPLQVMAGVTMSYCRHDAALQSQQAGDAVAGEEHCPYHDADAASAAKLQKHDQTCDNCGICHLACSGYMPASEVTTAVAPLVHAYQPWPVADLPSHIPEPPQYPPKRSAA